MPNLIHLTEKLVCLVFLVVRGARNMKLDTLNTRTPQDGGIRKAAPYYNNAPKASGYKQSIKFNSSNNDRDASSRKKKQSII